MKRKVGKKKVQEKEEESVVAKPISATKMRRDLYWVIGAMIVLLVLFFVASYFFRNLDKFDYKGLAFTKIKYGEIPMYHYYYYFTDPTGQLIRYNLFLRNDPRKNNVSVSGDIQFVKNQTAYISVNITDLLKCQYGTVGIATLTSFLVNNQIDVKGGVPDEKIAKENNLTYVTCDNRPYHTVINLQSGDKTEITREGLSCHTITISGCDNIMKAIEKFELEAILDAKGRQAEENKNTGSGVFSLK